jgi:23S rRNA (uridine2552-2'-O)-methyltransferase
MYKPNDFYARKAKQENFAARSVYKLEAIDQKFKLLKQGQELLDLGCSPGSWSQYASQKIGSKGKIMGIDLTEMKIALPNAIFIQGDILTGSVSKWLLEAGFQTQLDGVISDMAPNTTGVKITDQSRSLALCEMAFSVATQHLRKGGYFICKIFDGPDVQQFREGIRPYFGKLSLLKPESTRKESKEFFIIGIDFQGIEGSKGLTG